MANRIVRMESITIENFKNVTQGTLDFVNKRRGYKASVLGLYGQNGSGKTALIDAMQLLKFALCGKSIPQKYADYINVDADCAKLKYMNFNPQDTHIHTENYTRDILKNQQIN